MLAQTLFANDFPNTVIIGTPAIKDPHPVECAEKGFVSKNTSAN